MKKIILSITICFASVISFAQVGIGTTTPNSASVLDVVSTDKGFLMPRMTTVQRGAITTSATTAGLQVYDTTTKSVWYHDGTSWIESANATAAGIGKFIDGNVATNAVYMDGNVGIGTTTPGTKIDIVTSEEVIARFKSTNAYPSIHISSDGTNQHPLLSFRNGSTQVGTIGVDEQKDILTFGRSSINDDYLVISSGGNVGIGTTTPTAKLHIEGANSILLNHGGYVSKGIKHSGHNLTIQTNATDRVIIPNMSGSLSQILLSGGQVNYPAFSFIDDRNTGVYSPTDNTLAITTDGSEAIRILANNNVGIGTATPEAKLHVKHATYNTVSRFESGDAGVNITFKDDTSSNRTIIGATGDRLYLGHISGGEQLVVLPNGNVGIGTTAPVEKLHVNGKIRTAISIYADYVFEEYYDGYSDIKEDYSFKSLKEVDNFIKENKHLPGITSIKDIPRTDEGLYSINITDLSVQLLEKVEELYLHTIEQENEIKKLKKENNSLKTMNNKFNSRLEIIEHQLNSK